MASIDKRYGDWRAQVRRGNRTLTKTFRMKADADAWARDIERAIDKDIDPSLADPYPRLARASSARLRAPDLPDWLGSAAAIFTSWAYSARSSAHLN